MTRADIGRRAAELGAWLEDYARRRDSDRGADPGELLAILAAYLRLRADLRRVRARYEAS